MPIKPDMLTADELEALRKDAKEAHELGRRAFGGGPKTPEEIESERRGDEWWEKRLREMREQEAKRAKIQA